MKNFLHVTAHKVIDGRTFVSLREHHNYRLYFSGQFLSQIGTWLQSAAMAWLVLELTHSAFQVGMLTFWQFGPYLVLGLFGGALSDRFDHRKMLIVTQVALALCSGIIAVLTLMHIVTVWETFTIAAIRGVVLIFNNPSRQAFIFQMVGRKELPNAISLNSSVANATRIIGPGLGGLLIAGFGVGVCFSIDAISYVAVVVAMLMMHVDELLPIERRGKPSLIRGMGEGFRYVFQTSSIWLALTIFIFICTLSINFNVLLPLVASDTLHADAQIYGLLTACFGAGALIGALISASVGRGAWRVLLISAMGFGIGELLLAPQSSIIGAILALLFTGVCYTIYTSNTNTIVQLSTPGYLQGRVSGLYSYIFSSSNAVGGLLVGMLANRGGTQLALWIGGGTAVIFALFGMVMRSRTVESVIEPAPLDSLIR
jgi:MFS family permease